MNNIKYLLMQKLAEGRELTEHEVMFNWYRFTYSSWILNLESLRPVIKYFGNKSDAFNFNNGEHFEELRRSTMLEF